MATFSKSCHLAPSLLAYNEKTENKLIHIAKPIPFDTENFLKDLDVLAKACYENSENIIDLVRKIVPTFHPEEVDAKNKKEKSENIKR